MSRYGFAVYGVDFYGAGVSGVSGVHFSTVLFAKSGSTAETTSAQVGKITLIAQKPTGVWTNFRLVRSAAGFPVDEQDGIVVIAGASSDYSLTQLDIGLVDRGLKPSTYFYYTLWLRATRTDGTYTWLRAADAQGLSVGSRGYGSLLLERLPGVIRDQDQGAQATPDSTTLLGRYLNLLGFVLDAYRDSVDALLYVNDAQKVPGQLLPSLLQGLGFNYEASIGMAQNRTLARNAVFIHEYAGTSPGTVALISSITGWGTTALPLPNLFLNEDDATADTTTGSWVVDSTAGVLTRTAAGGALTNGAFVLTNNTGATANLTIGLGTTKLQAVPLQGGVQYTYAATMLGGSSPALVLGGTFLGDEALGTVLTPATAVDGTGTRYQVTLTPSGTNGLYFRPTITAQNVPAGGSVSITRAQIEQGLVANSYRSAREIPFNVQANRVNECINGGFDTSTNLFTSTGTLAWSGTAAYDSGLGALTAALGASGGSVSTTVALRGGDVAVLQYKTRAADTSTGTCTATLTYKNVSNAVISTFVAASGAYSSAWTTLSGRFVVPAGTTSVSVVISYATAAISSSIVLDDVLVERGNGVKDFFDSHTQPDNVVVEGTSSDNSRIHFYRNRRARQSRILSYLPNYTPAGSKVRLLYAQPRA